MDDLVRLLDVIDVAGKESDPPLAIATVVNTRGSAYRRPGARMLVRQSMAVQGAVSAGCLERDIVANCQYMRLEDKPVLLTYDGSSADELIFGLKLGCDGIVQILVEPLPMQNSFGLPKYKRVQKLVPQLLAEHGRLIAVTIFELSAPDAPELDESACAGLVMLESGKANYELASIPRPVSNYLRAQAQAALSVRGGLGGRSFVVNEEIAGYTVSALIELVQPTTALMVFGSGQDVDPLVEMADVLGWRVTVVEETGSSRGMSGLTERFRHLSNTRVALLDFDHLTTLISRETINAAVVMTHDYERDGRILRNLLGNEKAKIAVPYIGVVGPKRRSDKLLAELALAGLPITEAETARLYSPVGLDLGAERPEEIALSILAEIKAVLAGHRGGMLREKTGPIHEPTVTQVKSREVALNLSGADSSDRYSAVDSRELEAFCALSDV